MPPENIDNLALQVSELVDILRARTENEGSLRDGLMEYMQRDPFRRDLPSPPDKEDQETQQGTQDLRIDTEGEIFKRMREQREQAERARAEEEALSDIDEDDDDERNRVIEKATPVSIVDIDRKAFAQLSQIFGGKQGDVTIEKDAPEKKKGFFDALLDMIGMPLLALTGGIMALLSAANIDFDYFEGLMNVVGKQGLVAGLKFALKPFAKLFARGLKFLKPIPLIGALVSFYFAYERFTRDDPEPIRGAIDLVSGLLNLAGPFTGGITTAMSFGLDILNAFLDYTYGRGSAADMEIKDDAMDLFEKYGGRIWNLISPYLKHVPFIGSIFRFSAAIDMFDLNTPAGYMSGALELLGAFSILTPFVGPILYPLVSGGISVLQAMFDLPTSSGTDFASKPNKAGNIWDRLTDGIVDIFSKWYMSQPEIVRDIIDFMIPESWEKKLQGLPTTAKLSAPRSITKGKDEEWMRDRHDQELRTVLMSPAGFDDETRTKYAGELERRIEAGEIRDKERAKYERILEEYRQRENRVLQEQINAAGTNAYVRSMEEHNDREKAAEAAKRAEDLLSEQLANASETKELLKRQNELVESQLAVQEQQLEQGGNSTVVNNSNVAAVNSSNSKSIRDHRQSTRNQYYPYSWAGG